MLSLSGIPVIYSGDEVGQLNDYSYKEDPDKAADSRYIHRGKFNWNLPKTANALTPCRADCSRSLTNWSTSAKPTAFFDSNADVRTIDTWDASILAVVRENPMEKFIGIYNFSEQDKVAWINEEDGMYLDLISGRKMEARGVQIPAFGCYWLCREK